MVVDPEEDQPGHLVPVHVVGKEEHQFLKYQGGILDEDAIGEEEVVDVVGVEGVVPLLHEVLDQTVGLEDGVGHKREKTPTLALMMTAPLWDPRDRRSCSAVTSPVTPSISLSI